jgi:hypothetical protein
MNFLVHILNRRLTGLRGISCGPAAKHHVKMQFSLNAGILTDWDLSTRMWSAGWQVNQWLEFKLELSATKRDLVGPADPILLDRLVKVPGWKKYFFGSVVQFSGASPEAKCIFIVVPFKKSSGMRSPEPYNALVRVVTLNFRLKWRKIL